MQSCLRRIVLAAALAASPAAYAQMGPPAISPDMFSSEPMQERPDLHEPSLSEEMLVPPPALPESGSDTAIAEPLPETVPTPEPRRRMALPAQEQGAPVPVARPQPETSAPSATARSRERRAPRTRSIGRPLPVAPQAPAATAQAPAQDPLRSFAPVQMPRFNLPTPFAQAGERQGPAADVPGGWW